jgi:RNA polymerase sigma factor (sigma-70 family)
MWHVHPLTPTSEAEAVAALRRGENGGLMALVEQHQLPALRLAYGITGSRAAAEDVVADAFVSVYEHRDRLDPDRPFRPWFTRIVVNRALSVARRNARLPRLLALLGARPARGHDPEEQVERNEVRRQVVDAVRALPPDERVAIALRYFEDMDERGMADLLGWPVGTVKTRLRRARAHLRVRLGSLQELWVFGPTGGNR